MTLNPQLKISFLTLSSWLASKLKIAKLALEHMF